MDPMCLVDEEDGSVLEISDGKVIVNPNMDFTNLNQHWYIYPDNQRDEAFTIVTGKEQQALLLDDSAELLVKQCDSEEDTAQWKSENGCLVVKTKWHEKNKRFYVYPMV